MDKDRISGMHIYYYFVCKRELWYYMHGLGMEADNENVLLGKLLDENSYKNSDKHIMIDGVINIDYISEHNMIHEVKKSRKIEEAGIWQLKYYLYYLKNKGVSGLKGRIDYPLLKQNKIIELSQEDEKQLEIICDEIAEISESNQVPLCMDKKICKKCAYYEFCCI